MLLESQESFDSILYFLPVWKLRKEFDSTKKLRERSLLFFGWGPPSGNLLPYCCLRVQFGVPSVLGHGMVSGGLIGNFVLSLALLFLTLAPWHSQWTRQPFLFFSSFYLYVCILLFHLSIWFSPWVCFVLSSVSRVVITDCPSLVNFFANMCYHALLCNHLCNVLLSFIL